jgi:hypothetical protein
MQFAILAFAVLSGASAVSTNRFLSSPDSSQHAKEDAMSMWAVADMDLKESKGEQQEAANGLNDAMAIKAAA